MSNHTPGPWATGKEANAISGQVIRDQRGVCIAVLSPATISLSGGQVVHGAKEASANACLIASSPDMLGALRDMLNTLTDGPDESDVARVFNVARAAIAKATGEQP